MFVWIEVNVFDIKIVVEINIFVLENVDFVISLNIVDLSRFVVFCCDKFVIGVEFYVVDYIFVLESVN